MDWHSIEGHRLLVQVFPQHFLPVRGVFTVGGWVVVSVTKQYVDFYRPEEPGRAPASFRHYFAQIQRRGRPKTTPLDLGEMLPLPDPQDPATWGALVACLWRQLEPDGEQLPADATLTAPSNYGEPWDLTWGYCYRELPVGYGEAQWWADMKRAGHYAMYAHATCDPAEALVYALIQMGSVK